MESTYGGRKRSGDPEKELYSFLMKVSRESRVGIIASFAVARGQLLITLIHEFFKRHPEEKIRVVIDSPMMREANRAYYEFSNLTKMELQIQEAMENIEVIEHQRQWESLSKKTGPLVIISSSGMMTGGRISRHLMNWQDDERAVLFLPGYQGEGTPGRAFLNGDRVLESDHKRIVWKGEVIGSEAFSSHADQSELLIWLDELPGATPVYLIHGEESSKKALAEKLKEKGLKPHVPAKLETIGL
jgi:metallo-beta-lactamase family protein